MLAYFAVIHKDEESAYGVSWPDLPGCVSAADSLGEVDAQAREALQFHIEGMREDGEELPAASSFEKVYEAHKADEGFYGVALVSVPGKIVRRPISLRVSEIDLAVIDSAAAARGLDRTTFMVDAAKKVATEAR